MNDKNVTYEVTLNVFDLAGLQLDQDLNELRQTDEFMGQINSAGLTGESLKLKLGLLNKLCRNVTDFLYRTKQNLIDYFNKQLTSLLRIFLKYLDAFLGSLKTVFPPLEVMKELKEII